MPRWTTPDARVHVYTFKEGLLAAVGHDLLLEAGRVSVTEEGGRITAEIDAGSLRTVHAMRRGEPASDTLSEKDRADIDRNVQTSVLHPDRFPVIRFVADEVGDAAVRGELELHGVRRRLTLPVQRVGDRRVAAIELDQREYGIAPFSALLGTLKVKPVVRIEVSLPA